MYIFKKKKKWNKIKTWFGCIFVWNDRTVTMPFSSQISWKYWFNLISNFYQCSYGNEELLTTLAQLHDSLLPSFQRGFRIIFTAGEDEMISKIAMSLKMLSMRIVKFGWRLLDICYLSDGVFEDSLPLPAATKMFPAKVEDPFIRADILVQTVREIDLCYRLTFCE